MSSSNRKEIGCSNWKLKEKEEERF